MERVETDLNTLVSLVSSNPSALRIVSEEGGQELGRLAQGDGRKLTILPLEGSPLAGINPGPYADRGDAMAAISAHLNGTCLHARSNAVG
jgi:hypothetical protein